MRIVCGWMRCWCRWVWFIVFVIICVSCLVVSSSVWYWYVFLLFVCVFCLLMN